MKARIDHVAIAVRSIADRLPFWSDRLGLEVDGQETVPSERVNVAFLDLGPSRVELLEPTEADSPVGRFIARHGEGLHHLTLAVPDLDAVLARLTASGVAILGDGTRPGAGGRPVAFLHPAATGGVLVELCEERRRIDDLGPGAAILAYLREPQEKFWGVLRKIDAAGVVLEGVDLSSFDDWVGQIERQEEGIVGASTLFVPMTRVEKLLLDRASEDLPSLSQRFERRVGRSVQEILRPRHDG